MSIITLGLGDEPGFMLTLGFDVGVVQAAIVTQPESLTVTAPEAGAFEFEFEGAMSVQAQRRANLCSDWVDMPGATSTGYTTPSTCVAEHGVQYRFIGVGADGEEVVSDVVDLIVLPTHPALVDAVLFEDMLSRVMPYVGDCNPITAAFHLREAAIEFFERTHTWKEDFPAVTCDDDTSEYTVVIPEQTAVAKVFDEDFEARAASAQGGDGSCSTHPDCNGLTLEIALKPARDAEAIPGLMYERYVDPIAWGALGRLLMLPSTFRDLKLGAEFQAKFELYIARCGMAVSTRGSKMRKGARL